MPIESKPASRWMSPPPHRRFSRLARLTAMAAMAGWCLNALAGDSVELSLRTLAQLQRQQEEKALREKLETLTEGMNDRMHSTRGVSAGPTSSPTSSPLRPGADRSAAPAPAPAPALKPPAAYTVLSVYGVPPALTVEAQTPAGDVHRFTERAVWGRWRIERIAIDGVWLQGTGHGSRRFVGLGDMLRDTEHP